MGGEQTIQLGAHTYTVRPQKLGYLIHKLGSRLQEALEAEVDGLNGASLVGAKAHDVLAVFIPDLMPLHEFLGFGSEEAMKASAYDEALDRSPEPLQIKAAFKAASDVNGGEVLGHLKALLGPVLTERVVAVVMAKMGEEFATRTTPAPSSPTSAPSPTSPPTSGVSDPMSSGTAAPISTPSAA